MEINQLPLEYLEDDKLKFIDKAQKIAEHINYHPSQLPYSISIRGAWGAGKSTMLNFIEEFLDTGYCSIIHFNSWLVTDKELLISNLFEEIYYQIMNVFPKVKEKFLRYAQKIIPPVSKAIAYFAATSNGLDSPSASAIANVTGESIKGITEEFSEKPLSVRKKELYQVMSEYSKGYNKKIVVLVDEIDRLFPEEIITVFQMIKSALDLPGIVFVVAIDEHNAFQALNSKGIINEKEYLEKIFNKNYYINSQYQIQTLTNSFIMSNLGEEEYELKLKECIDAYLLIKKEKFFNIYPEYIEIEEENQIIKYELQEVDSQKLTSSYYEMYWAFSDLANLRNPRKFLKFTQSVLELWEGFYNKFLKERKIEDYELHAAFVIFSTYILRPVDVSHNLLSIDAKEITDDFIKKVRSHLLLLLPNIQRELSGNKLTTRRNDKIIRDSLLYLYQYPDFQRISVVK